MFNLYENIQSLCEKRGVTVSGMCVAIGKSKSTLSNLRNGRSDTLAMRTAQLIADYLQVPLDVVLHGEKEAPAAESDERNIKSPTSEEIGPVRRALLEEIKDYSEEEAALLLARARKIKDSR